MDPIELQDNGWSFIILIALTAIVYFSGMGVSKIIGYIKRRKEAKTKDIDDVYLGKDQ
jgi:hypothetical protein